ncbi:ATP-binding protein [Deinococcus yavapaiensis]|uniref:Anti-sigma regulatory factor (Ser/Thr protein kinase) n=1 Tax=Deinococcus yavapaiensis KR-236 TaxID=694435 RepID=A0A318SGY2_9DEIO|nr:ATP-binding protein [Deinococcus yavapaiensis]PYE49901.1 anti-sigma regulatory factor (Ser/Thr protein kinase) [Deinococcus yavapaiensis KR-236]
MTATLQVPADTAFLAQLGEFTQRHCARSSQVVLIDLAVTELATNAIRHGRARTLRLAVDDRGDEYCLTFEDDGEPFDSVSAEAQPTGELREGGYGLPLVRRISKAMTYERRDGLNAVRLVFEAGGSV